VDLWYSIAMRALVASFAAAVSRTAVVLLLPPALLAAPQSPPSPPPFDLAAGLQRLRDPRWLYRPAPAGERCVQWSSFDPRSRSGPGDADAWYANDDRGHYVRTVDGPGGKEYVLADTTGPGCVARLWSANPQGTLHVDIDGLRVWSVDFAALLAGKVDGVPEPLAGMRSKGGNCHLPIPFGKSLVLSCTAGDLYYHVDVVQFAPGTGVKSFAPAQLQSASPAVQQCAEALQKGAWSNVWNSTVYLPKAIAPGGVLQWLEIGVKPGAPRAEVLDVLQRSRLVVRVGDETTVDVPLVDFFGAGPAWCPWRSLGLQANEGFSAICTLPMPFPSRGIVDVRTEGERGNVEFTCGMGIGVPEGGLPDDTLLFRASYHQQYGMPTLPRRDHRVLDATGKGRFVGCTLRIRNSSRIWWGEGDEKFTVDGEAFPSWFGTGTEDYFGYAWCEPTPFQSPLHAQIECQGPMNFGFTQLHRLHLLDSVPFERSFRFDLEVWHWVEQAKVDYATVAYWYGAKGASSGLPPVPDAAARALPRLDQPPVFVADKALEGEALRVLACPAGVHEVQDLGVFDQTFSSDKHRWWRDAKPGDALVLALPVAKAGRYRLRAAFVVADDFAIVQVQVGDKAIGAPFDGYAAKVASSGLRTLGDVELAAGEHELRLRIVGKNALAKPSHMVGLDYVVLEELP
jgi:hypothetical protein